MKKANRLKSLTPKQPAVPSTDDPAAELRRLVRQHKATQKSVVAMHHMATDRRVLGADHKPTGEVIACRLPGDVQTIILKAQQDAAIEGVRLESAMVRELRKMPIYTLFLCGVFGVGPVLSAYLCAEVDIHKAVKVSNLHRFCGLAVIDGKLERRAAGKKNAYNSDLRSKIYMAMMAMRKNAAPGKHGGAEVTSKYLKIWSDKKHGVLSRAPGEDGKTPSKGAADSAGWHVAARVLIEDLYIVWRAIEGLPVWPSYSAAKLGYAHGGKVCVNEPKMLSVEEALECVGAVGKRVVEAVAAE